MSCGEAIQLRSHHPAAIHHLKGFSAGRPNTHVCFNAVRRTSTERDILMSITFFSITCARVVQHDNIIMSLPDPFVTFRDSIRQQSCRLYRSYFIRGRAKPRHTYSGIFRFLDAHTSAWYASFLLIWRFWCFVWSSKCGVGGRGRRSMRRYDCCLSARRAHTATATVVLQYSII